MVKILGTTFAAILEEEDPYSGLRHLIDKEEDPGEDLEVKVKLCHLIHDMDKQLLSELLKEISEWVLLFYLLLLNIESNDLSVFLSYPLFFSDLTRFAATCACF